MFPWEIAQRLGIDAALEPDAQGAMGVEGTGFPTWSHPGGIQGQVVRIPPANPAQPELWGPAFSMTPSFCHKSVFLLGRQDFFLTYRVLFHPATSAPPKFSIF